MMNILMVIVSDEKEGYVKLKKDELMKMMQAVYENGFNDGKYTVETRKPIESGKMYFIGGDNSG